MKKIRKANLGMSFNGAPLLTQLDPNNQFNTVQFGQNPDPSSEPKKYTLLPNKNWLSWQGPYYDKYLTQQIETPSPNNQQKEKVNNQQIEEVNNPFEEKNSPLHIGNLLILTGNKDLQGYGNELWKRGLKQAKFKSPYVDDKTTYFSNKPLNKSFQEYIDGHLPKPPSELTNVNLNETPVDKKFNTDELNNAYSSLGEYGDAAVRLGHSLGVGIGGEWGDAVSKAATGALVTTNAIKNLKKLKGVKGQNVAKAGNAAAIAGAVSDVASSFLPEKTEYAGDKGNVTETIDTIYDGVSNAAMAFGPIGMLVGGAMKTASLLGKGFNALGGGTDGKTTQDAILGSSLFNWNVGLINGFGGSKAETITKDEDVQAKIGSGYLGSYNKIDRALADSGAKYGLFSSASRRHANNRILEALRQQNILTDIADYATDRFDIRNSMAAINGNKRRFQMQGGYNQSAISVGRNGMVIKDLQHAKRITSSMKYQKGGKVSDPYQSYLQTLPEYQRDDSNFRVRDYWEFNGRPKDFNEAISKGMFTQFEDGWHANSVAENPKTGEIEFMKSSSHPSIQKELDWYESDDASEFRNQYELQKTEPYFKYVKRKGTDQPQSFKEGGNLTNQLVELDFNSISDEFRGIDEIDINNISHEFRGIDEVNLDSILPEFKEGGSLKPENSPSSNKESSYEWTIDYVKSKDLDWVKRWLDPNRATIPDWEMEGRVATHKLSRDSGDFDGKTMYVVYPKVQSINGQLYDFTDPKNKRGKRDAYDSAINNHEAVIFEDEGAADWFVDHYKEYAPAFDKYREGGNLTKKSRTLEELIEYAKQQNPRFVQRMSEPIKDIDLGDGKRGTHRLSYGEVDGRTIVYPEIYEGEDGELIFDPKNAVKHALDNKDFLEMSPEEAELFTADNYKQGWPEFFQKYLQGGKFNLIPEGALHARKHNMDVEGITKKGIPVVSESPDGKLEQQAEIEREEIILRLEVTKKIEELAKDGSDEAAIEAGKLLVKEILYNTVDNTNSLI